MIVHVENEEKMQSIMIKDTCLISTEKKIKILSKYI